MFYILFYSFLYIFGHTEEVQWSPPIYNRAGRPRINWTTIQIEHAWAQVRMVGYNFEYTYTIYQREQI